MFAFDLSASIGNPYNSSIFIRFGVPQGVLGDWIQGVNQRAG